MLKVPLFFPAEELEHIVCVNDNEFLFPPHVLVCDSAEQSTNLSVRRRGTRTVIDGKREREGEREREREEERETDRQTGRKRQRQKERGD